MLRFPVPQYLITVALLMRGHPDESSNPFGEATNLCKFKQVNQDLKDHISGEKSVAFKEEFHCSC